ncbi:MAG: EF-hand domain-containing protein [Hyphomicrobiales bacterium]
MRKVTKVAIAAGAVVLAGAAGFATFAAADYGHRGGWHKGGHHGHQMGGYGKGRHMAMLLERFDADKDGKLTQDELNQSRQDLLAKHDADKDGKLSLKEFETLWMEVMHRRMVRGFQRIDVDGDAAITTEEFLKPYSELVSRMDRNDDGVLDVNDRKRSWHHKHDRDGGKDKERKG